MHFEKRLTLTGKLENASRRIIAPYPRLHEHVRSLRLLIKLLYPL